MEEDSIVVENEGYFSSDIKNLNTRNTEKCRRVKSLFVPSSVESIASGAFKKFLYLESIDLPDSIKEINREAFTGCTNLKGIRIPKKVTQINYGTFTGCDALQEVALHKGVKRIASYAFTGCESLKSIILPKGIREIYGNAFEKSGLESITIPSSIKEISFYSFRDCTHLSQVNLPKGIKEIGVEAFGGCRSLKSIELPSSIRELRDSAFSKCTTLNNVVLPKKVTSLRVGVFASCFELSDITFKGRIQTVENSAFYRCKALTKINLPESVKKIEGRAFSGSGLESFTFPKKVKEVSTALFQECVSLKEVVLNKGMKEIQSSAFSSCSVLKQVEIPSTVSRIGTSAFYNCVTLEQIKLPDGLQKIEANCFGKCLALEKLEIPDSVHTIGKEAFKGCQSLNELVLPSGLTAVENDAFADCGFKYVYIDKKSSKVVYCKNLPENTENCTKITDLNHFRNIEGFDISKLFNVAQIEDYSKVADKLNKSKLSLPASFIEAMKAEGLLEKMASEMDFRYFRAEIPDLNKIFEKLPNENGKIAFMKFAIALGCFSTEKLLDKNGRETETPIAQKASSCLASILKVNDLTVEEIAKNCKDLSFKIKPSQDLIKFLSTKGENKNLPNIDMLETLEIKYPGIFAKVIGNFEEVKGLRIGLDEKGMPYNVPWNEVLINYYSMTKYDNVTAENKDIAELFIEKGLSQKVFDEARVLRETAIKDKVPRHILNGHLKEETIFETIERVRKETESKLQDNKQLLDTLFAKKFTYEMLDKHDPKNAIIGLYASCCATLTSPHYGKVIAESTMIKDDVQNMVVRDSQGEIVAKGTMYVNKDKGYAVINDFEINAKYKDHESDDVGFYDGKNDSEDAKDRDLIFKAFMRGIEAFVKEYDEQNPNKPIKQVNVGLGYNRLQAQCRAYESDTHGLTVPAEYKFNDALDGQRILYKRDSVKTETKNTDGGRAE